MPRGCGCLLNVSGRLLPLALVIIIPPPLPTSCHYSSSFYRRDRWACFDTTRVIWFLSLGFLNDQKFPAIHKQKLYIHKSSNLQWPCKNYKTCYICVLGFILSRNSDIIWYWFVSSIIHSSFTRSDNLFLDVSFVLRCFPTSWSNPTISLLTVQVWKVLKASWRPIWFGMGRMVTEKSVWRVRFPWFLFLRGKNTAQKSLTKKTNLCDVGACLNPVTAEKQMGRESSLFFLTDLYEPSLSTLTVCWQDPKCFILYDVFFLE